MLEIYPEGSTITTRGGWIPLHYAIDMESPSYEVIDLLCEAYPNGPFVHDQENKYAIHWAVDRAILSINIIR